MYALGLLNVHRRRQNVVRRPCSTTEGTQKYIRLNEQQLEELSSEFSEWRRVEDRDRGNLKSEKMMEVFLDFLAGGGYYRQVGRSAGVATSTAFKYTRLGSDFLYDMAPRYIRLPEPHEYEDLTDNIQLPNGEIKRVIMYIDGYIARIQRPDHAGDAYFCGRHGKSCDSINTQYISDKFGVVRHVITGVPGSTHDKTATEWSGAFIQYLDNLPDDVVVLGDPAYRNLHRSVCHRIVGNNLNEEERRYNDDVTRLRQVIERTIGATQLKWRMSQMKENRLPAKGGIIFASKCIISVAVLHNRFTNFLRNW